MKKLLLILLALAMCVSLCACGWIAGTTETPTKTAFDISKEAYDKVLSAYEITELFSSDIYEAWRLGIYEDDSIISQGNKYLAGELNLSEAELDAGLARVVAFLEYDKEWDELTDSEKNNCKNKCFEFGDTALYSIMKDELFTMCTMVVAKAYEANGKSEEAEAALNDAKALMKQLSEKHSDYEHYPNLKGFYTTTSSFFNFCKEPSGSFEQVIDTLNDYRKEARDFKSDLDYIFED